jgi:hypothetical protein
VIHASAIVRAPQVRTRRSASRPFTQTPGHLRCSANESKVQRERACTRSTDTRSERQEAANDGGLILRIVEPESGGQRLVRKMPRPRLSAGLRVRSVFEEEQREHSFRTPSAHPCPRSRRCRRSHRDFRAVLVTDVRLIPAFRVCSARPGWICIRADDNRRAVMADRAERICVWVVHVRAVRRDVLPLLRCVRPGTERGVPRAYRVLLRPIGAHLQPRIHAFDCGFGVFSHVMQLKMLQDAAPALASLQVSLLHSRALPLSPSRAARCG